MTEDITFDAAPPLPESAMEPDETINTARPSPCSRATSSASAVSQASRTLPAAASTRSDEPTLITILRKSDKAGFGRLKRVCGGEDMVSPLVRAVINVF